MHFLYDLQTLQSESRGRGIGRYSRGLAGELLRDCQDSSALLNTALEDHFDEERRWCEERLPQQRVLVFRGLTRIRGVDPSNQTRALACEALYDAFVATHQVDLVHFPSPFEGFGDDTVVGWGERTRTGPARAATVHDLIPFEEPAIYLADPLRKHFYERRFEALARADLVLAVSAHTRQVARDLLGIEPSRVVNTSSDTEPVFRKVVLSPEAQARLLTRYGIDKPFIMHTGILEPRKNVETLVRALAQLSPELRAGHVLVLVGETTPAQIAHMRSVARAADLSEETLVFPGFVPDADLAALYGLARAAVMPSLTEGFGLPVLEGMRCGAPVLAADRTSLPEVVGNPELLFDPQRPSALAEKLTRLLTDAGFRDYALAHGAKQEKKFSWAISAARTREAFAEAVKRRRAELKAKERPRYVLVPPDHLDARRAADVSAIVAALQETEPVLATRDLDGHLAGSGCALVKPETINVIGNQRVVLLAGAHGLDQTQSKILTTTPAAVVTIEPDAPVQPSRETLYRWRGYAALLAEPAPELSRDTVLAVSANVLGVLNGSDDLRSRIETLYANQPLGSVPRLLDEIASLGMLEEADVLAVAEAIAQNHAPPAAPRLLVDISELVHRDAKSGIQRVVRSVLKHLLMEPRDRRIEPIYRDNDVYRYARRFTCDFLNIDTLALPDAVVDFHGTDIFFGLDFDLFINSGAIARLRGLRAQGGSVVFLVHDLMPVAHPEWFATRTKPNFLKWFDLVSEEADRIIAVSRAVADEVMELLEQRPPRRALALDVTWSHNGYDLAGSVPTFGIKPEEAEMLARLEGRTVFLTVGTIEPRKGISQLLDAADVIWSQQDVAFVLAGKRGWKVDRLILRIRQHPEFGKRLFWFEGVSDELLGRLYAKATAVVMPTEGEGFGLPLVEAARHGTPIIARDLKVLREVGRSGVYYFSGEGADIAAALRAWLALHAERKAPGPRGINILSWLESTNYLLKAVYGQLAYKSWKPG